MSTGPEDEGPRGWRRLLIEPRRPPSIREHRHAHWLVLAAVCLGAFLGQLDASIVTLALPTLQGVFHASVGAVTWVGLSYLLVLVVMVVPVGRFADMVGRKLLYTYGFLVFIVGSALCGLAPSLGALAGFRAFQALGAAMLQANSVAIIYLAMPKGKLGRGIGVQGAAQAIGLALGPSIGGLLLAAGGWRLIFLVNVPVGLVGMVAAWLFIPRSRHLQERVRFDWFGLVLFSGAVFLFLGPVSLGNSLGWTSPVVIGSLAAAAVLATAYLLWEHRTRWPMLDLSLFRRRAFSTGLAGGLLAYLVMFGVLFAVPFALERVGHIGVGLAGLELTVMPLALGLTAPLAGRLADRFGPRPLTVTGMAIVAATLLPLAFARPGSPAFLVGLALIGVGIGLFTPPNNASIMAAAPRSQSGVAGGVLNMTRGLGTALGLAATGAVYSFAGAGDPTRGFEAAAVFLATAAVGAAVLTGSSGARRAMDRADEAIDEPLEGRAAVGP